MLDEIGTNQETSENIPISPNSDVNMGSELSTTPSEPPESSRNADIPVSLNNDNPENGSVLTSNSEVEKPAESGSVEVENPKVEPISEPVKTSETGTAQIPPNEPLVSRNRVIELLNKAKLAIQFRKRKKLDRIMEMFAKQTKITNDEVEKFLHVSDATAERYLNILEKENKIKQVGKTGKAVWYSRI
jgi:hypothetical protein